MRSVMENILGMLGRFFKSFINGGVDFKLPDALIRKKALKKARTLFIVTLFLNMLMVL